MSGDEIARCGRVASFKNKTVEFNPDNCILIILNIGLADEAVVRCEVVGEIGHYYKETQVRVRKGKCCNNLVLFCTKRTYIPPLYT